MKLSKAGEPRGNRFTRAIDVLGERREPKQPLWNPKDPEVFEGWVKEAKGGTGAFAYATAVLRWLKPQAISTEHLERIKKMALGSLEHEVREWRRSKGSLQELSVIDITTTTLFKMRLIDPQFQPSVPEEYLQRVHSWGWDPKQLYRNNIRGFRLLFPGEPEAEKKQAWADWVEQGLNHEASRDDQGHDLIANLATLRLIDEDRFQARGVSVEERRAMQVFLAQSRKGLSLDSAHGFYPEELWMALIVDADQVSLTQERGLEMSFRPTEISPAPGLPLRSTA